MELRPGRGGGLRIIHPPPRHPSADTWRPFTYCSAGAGSSLQCNHPWLINKLCSFAYLNIPVHRKQRRLHLPLMCIQEKGREEVDRKVRSHTPSPVLHIHLLVSFFFKPAHSFLADRVLRNFTLYLVPPYFSFGKAKILPYFLIFTFSPLALILGGDPIPIFNKTKHHNPLHPSALCKCINTPIAFSMLRDRNCLSIDQLDYSSFLYSLRSVKSHRLGINQP